MALPQLHFRDQNSAVAAALRDRFPVTIRVSCGGIFSRGVTADAIVSPANSFGRMDGGIDRVYRKRFGEKMQRAVLDRVAEFGGEIPVGSAAIVSLEDPEFRFLIVAPTMRIPMDVSETDNARLAFAAALRAASGVPAITSLLCPGLCTAIGGMNPAVAASQMYEAWSEPA